MVVIFSKDKMKEMKH